MQRCVARQGFGAQRIRPRLARDQWGLAMNVQTAADSLVGNRDENQDRLAVLRRGDTLLAAVVDGMGGHAAGAQAAQTAVDTFHAGFNQLNLPVKTPQDTLAELLRQAHDAVVALGATKDIVAAPRATCVIALIQGTDVTWAHVGDSRVYLLRDGDVAARTRDHSHVEVLLREGLITEDEYRTHPLRNYVEYCLGGEPGDPTLTLSDTRPLVEGDQLLLCSDGVWSGIDDPDIARLLDDRDARRDPQAALTDLLERAVAQCAPAADNTTAALILWQGPDADDAA